MSLTSQATTFLNDAAFNNSVTAFSPANTANGRLLMWLDSTRWMCQGMYLFTETCTLLDTMGVTEHQWAGWMTIEANKFWFYALFLGIVIGILQLASLSAPMSPSSEDEKEEEKVKEKFTELEKKYFQKRSKIMRQLMVDGCDLVIPSGVVGWYVASCSNTSMLMLTSTVLAAVDIWGRVNSTG
ncbi:hypothetical protein HYALB_00012481 [Hymenoscyphus albidus]|uniref:Uncharacterized protein n=1 Tax=Hymenoscyphus albidus TaxID=595503 RepID=A0A9N9LU96_9HELO|nr:hypothetical protein HYALB_00012481 [Hymenoscyphus albidus]